MGLLDGWRGRREQLPRAARDALALGARERLLAWAQEDGTGIVVAATPTTLQAVASTGERVLLRPWHEVQHGSWVPERSTLRVELVGAEASQSWVFEGEPRMLLQALRERVQASVVLAEEVELSARRRLQVAIRKDLATGELVEQVVLGARVAPQDPDAIAAAEQTLARLRDDVGLT